MFVVKPDGSGLRKIADIDSDSIQQWDRGLPFPYLSWSPDGSEILLQDYPFIRVKVDGSSYDEGGEPYAVFNGPEDWNVAYASWSPDGSRIAVTVEHMGESGPNIGDAILLTMARDGSDKRVLARISTELGLHAVPNEPWEERSGNGCGIRRTGGNQPGFDRNANTGGDDWGGDAAGSYALQDHLSTRGRPFVGMTVGESTRKHAPMLTGMDSRIRRPLHNYRIAFRWRCSTTLDIAKSWDSGFRLSPE